jgi:hypothetical protein
MAKMTRLLNAILLQRKIRSPCFQSKRSFSNSSNSSTSTSTLLTARRRLIALGAAGFTLFTLLRFEEWLDASLQTLDSSFATFVGNTHPFGEFTKSNSFLKIDGSNSPEDDDESYQPDDDLSLDGGLLRRRNRDFSNRRNISFSSFTYGGRKVDVCVMKSDDTASIDKPVVVINAGSIAAARPYLIAFSRAGLTAAAYTHGGLYLPPDSESLKGLKKPSLDQFGTSFGPFNGIGGGFFVRVANALIQGAQSTGDPLPMHSEALMPLGYPARLTSRGVENSADNFKEGEGEDAPSAPTSESQSAELSAVLSHLRVNRAILVSSSFHWLSTIKTALRNKNYIAGLVCVDPAFPTSSPRVVVSQSGFDVGLIKGEEEDKSPLVQMKEGDYDTQNGGDLLVNQPSLQLTWLEKAMLRDIKNVKFPHPLSGPLINPLGVSPYTLLAPQQLAPPVAAAVNTSGGLGEKGNKNTSASGRTAVSSLITNTLSPSLQTSLQPVAIHGSDLYEAAFVRSQVVGAAYGKSGLLPPWLLFRQESNGTPLLTRLFGWQAKETVDYFKNLKSGGGGGGGGGITTPSKSAASSANDESTPENKLTHLTFELDVAGSRSPFLDIIRLSTVLSNKGSGFRAVPSINVEQTSSAFPQVPGILGSFSEPDPAYVSDGAALGSFLWNLSNSFTHRARALDTGTTFSPCPLEDARMAYTMSMLEGLRAENHYYLLAEQASNLLKRNSNAKKVGKSEKEAASAVSSIIDEMAVNPISCASLSGNSPLKGALIRISLAQAGTKLPEFGKKDIFAPGVDTSLDGRKSAPVIADLLVNARTDVLVRAAAALQISPTVSPLLLSKEVDAKSVRLKSLLRKTSSTSTSTSSSSTNAIDMPLSVSTAASAYAGVLGLWTSPIAFNLSPSRWNVPIHAVDRFGEAVGRARPALLMTSFSKQSPELDSAYAAFHAITNKNKGGRGGGGGDGGGGGGGETRNSLSAINIPSFQGLLSFASANLNGASTPAQWKSFLYSNSGGGEKRSKSKTTERLNLPSSSVPFPVSMLLTELTEKQLIEPVSGPPQLDFDSEHELSLLGVDSTVTVSGITAPPLGTSPNGVLLHLRMLIQAHQKLQVAAWRNALPDAVVSLPAETAFDVALNLRQSVTPKLRGMIKRISSSSWFSILTGYGGEIDLKVSSVTSKQIKSDTDDSPWPDNTPRTNGSHEEPLALISDAVSYGPAQPYRPPISRVVNEVLGIADVDSMR